MKTNKIFALMGFVGGLLFVVGDGLLYWYAGNSGNGTDVDPLWAGLPEWRFVLSFVLGFAGMILMLPAFVSFYRMIAATFGRVLRLFTAFMGVGVAATGFLHFSIGSLPPITYKAVLDAGGTAAMAAAVSQHWIDVVTPVNLCLILFLCFEYIVHFTPPYLNPAFSTARRMSASEAVPVTVSVPAAGLASAAVTPLVFRMASSMAALQWLQSTPLTL